MTKFSECQLEPCPRPGTDKIGSKPDQHLSVALKARKPMIITMWTLPEQPLQPHLPPPPQKKIKHWARISVQRHARVRGFCISSKNRMAYTGRTGGLRSRQQLWLRYSHDFIWGAEYGRDFLAFDHYFRWYETMWSMLRAKFYTFTSSTAPVLAVDTTSILLRKNKQCKHTHFLGPFTGSLRHTWLLDSSHDVDKL